MFKNTYENLVSASAEPKVIKKFTCIERKKEYIFPRYKYIEEGYQLSNGICCIGIDACRSLNKHDCASYLVTHYSSIEDVEKIYKLFT